VVLKVKRPYMRSVPCAVECRADGCGVYALIGDSTSAMTDGKRGVIGFGDNLPEALRSLADAIEKEVEVTGEEVSIKTDYNIGDFVTVNEIGMPSDLRGKVGKVTSVFKDYPISVNFPDWGEVGFECSEVDPATDVEILWARLS
jgi:hypothetical protein